MANEKKEWINHEEHKLIEHWSWLHLNITNKPSIKTCYQRLKFWGGGGFKRFKWL